MIYFGLKPIAKFLRMKDALAFSSSSMSQVIKALFANNEQGFAFDFNDLSTMYQDSAGTIPVTGAGQPVGKVLDKSGRGNHATQSTSAKRPILQKNATTGAYYLAFDGVDDFLVTGNVDFSATNDFTVLSGNTKLNDTTARYLFSMCNTASIDSTIFALWVGGGGGANVGTESFTSKHPSTLFNIMTKSSYPSFNAPKSVVITLIHDNTNKKHYFTLNRAVSQQSTILNTNKIGNYPIYIGSRTPNDYFFNGNLYSLIGIARLATPTEISNTEKVIAKNVGVTL